MRYKILLDGEQVCNDKRGWYAVVSDRVLPESVGGGTAWDTDVWHPKDSPDNPDDRSDCNVVAAALDVEECLAALVEDGWLASADGVQLQPF